MVSLFPSWIFCSQRGSIYFSGFVDEPFSLIGWNLFAKVVVFARLGVQIRKHFSQHEEWNCECM